MKTGLKKIPDSKQLKKAYDRLIHQRPGLPRGSDIVLYSQWSRFDPRLAEILVAFLASHWEQYHPIPIRRLILSEPWPQALGVILEFVKAKLLPQDKNQLKLFHHWQQLVLYEVSPVGGELFFIGLRKIAGDLMLEDASFPLREYQKWGYLSREQLANAKGAGVYSVGTREQILRDLLHKLPRIRTSDYLAALGNGISRRQAERDLKNSPLVRSAGHSKGSYFLARQLAGKTLVR